MEACSNYRSLLSTQKGDGAVIHIRNLLEDGSLAEINNFRHSLEIYKN